MKILDKFLSLENELRPILDEQNMLYFQNLKTYLSSIVDLEKSAEMAVLKAELEKDTWPKVVEDTSLICSTEEDKCGRAEGIIETTILQTLAGLRFLDYGTGEGHVAKYASKAGAAFSVGYDVVSTGSLTWESIEDSSLLTTSLDLVKANGPYDVVLLFDILDHIKNDQQVETLKAIKELCVSGASIYVRCHPWCSRHGTHLYKQLNKAYVHLVFSDEEIEQMGLTQEFTTKVIHPLGTYQKWFKEAGYKIVNEFIEENLPEPFFFRNDVIKNRIISRWKTSPLKGTWPEFQLKQSFVDYILTV